MCGVYKKNVIFFLLRPNPATIKLHINPENKIVFRKCIKREEPKKYKELINDQQK